MAPNHVISETIISEMPWFADWLKKIVPDISFIYKDTSLEANIFKTKDIDSQFSGKNCSKWHCKL